MSTVLVTGGSGSVGSHAIVQLLQAGYAVRTTVRSLARDAVVRAMVKEAGVAVPEARFAVVAADLERDAGWAEAVAGCKYVLHVASPMPPVAPNTEDELIVPSRSAPFDETSWSNLDGEMSAYVKSKILAERAAWDFIAAEGGALELNVVNPAGIFGPVLGPDFSSSIEIVTRLLNGIPACPQIYFGVVDVRDVADLHLRAMTHPLARGERFIAVSGSAMSMLDIARVLRARLGDRARRVPTRQFPNWLVRVVARFDPGFRQLLPMLGYVRNATNAKAERILGWTPRPREDAIVATGESLLHFGLTKVQS